MWWLPVSGGHGNQQQPCSLAMKGGSGSQLRSTTVVVVTAFNDD